MAPEPLATEAIELTEKKMDMALDDIIKMSKNKARQSKKPHRAPNKSQKNFKNAAQQKSFKIRQYMDSRSSLRQGVLAQRRSNFQGNQFPFTSEVARKAAVVSLRSRPFNRNTIPVSNKTRVGGFAVRRPANPDFASKQPIEGKQQQQQQGFSGAKQRPQTLDSLFANMKEQRMRVISRQNNAVRHNGGGGQSRVPWARGRFGS